MPSVSDQQVPFARRFASTSALSILFLVLYGFCNRFTSSRLDVAVFRFDWEMSLPFMSSLILPYMSLDLFFVAAPFLAKTKRQLKTLEIQVAGAIVLSCVCFLLFPFKCTYVKPQVSGFSGWVFDHFLKMDLPYNQVPSLHIVLSVVLGAFYFTRFRGVLRWASALWFVVIGASTLLTYQHHAIDVVSGALAGVFCLTLGVGSELKIRSRHRIGALYLLSAILMAGVSLKYQGVTAILLWPALSLATLALAYFGFLKNIFPKQSHSRFAALLKTLALAPAILGHRLSHLYYSRHASAYNDLSSQVVIGRHLSERESKAVVDSGVGAVLDLSGEMRNTDLFTSLRYLHLPVLDLTSPTRDQIRDAIDFIESESRDAKVYVHCKAGFSRTAAISGCWLLETRRAKTADEALELLKAARPGMIIRPEAEASIREWQTEAFA